MTWTKLTFSRAREKALVYLKAFDAARVAATLTELYGRPERRAGARHGNF